MLQDRQGIPAGFPLHWSFADIVLPPEGEEATLLPSAGSGTSAVRQTAVSQEGALRIPEIVDKILPARDTHDSPVRSIRCANIAATEMPRNTIGRTRRSS